MDERTMVIRILDDIRKKDLFVNQVLDDYFYVYRPDQLSKGFISRLVYGIIENQYLLDYYIGAVSKIKINKMKPFIRDVLRLGTYQLLFMDKVPAHAAINESVKLVVKRKMHNLKGFVNGVLRNIERQQDAIKNQLSREPEIPQLSIRFSMDEAMVRYLLEDYSISFLEAYLTAGQESKKLCIRNNTLLQSKEVLESLLLSRNIKVTPSYIHPECMYLENYGSLENLDLFNEGRFTVQDESAALVGETIELKDQMNILDACSAPGGKSLHLAEKLKDQCSIISCDIGQNKLDKIESNCKRLNLKSIRVMEQDATVENKAFLDRFDTVIADVPCSGIGIIRQKPDIKLNMNPEKISNLIKIQENILDQVSRYVKMGGELIYSTCTINRKENMDQVSAFLQRHPTFELIDLSDHISLSPQAKACLVGGVLEIYTQDTGTDGFFIAKLKRKNNG